VRTRERREFDIRLRRRKATVNPPRPDRKWR